MACARPNRQSPNVTVLKETPNAVHPNGLRERGRLASTDQIRARTLVGRLQRIHGGDEEGWRPEGHQWSAAHLVGHHGASSQWQNGGAGRNLCRLERAAPWHS